uniref:hypothetical protein n=1 Tax=Dysosmobacter welbionis TaxID=2093857 RepID=UPI003FEEEA8D
QFAVDRRRCHAKPCGNVGHAVSVQVSGGNLLSVLKVYVSVLPHHISLPFLLHFTAFCDTKK